MVVSQAPQLATGNNSKGERKMSVEWKTVNIEGKPGRDVTIYPRDRGDDPPPAVFEGATNSSGLLKLLLPSGYYAVINSGGSRGGANSLDLNEGPDSVTLRLTED
jgi:hypothetical protein